MARVCKQIEVTEQTYYRWRKEYGGLKVEQAKRLKELKRERIAADDEVLTRAIVRFAEGFGRYGCRRNTALLLMERRHTGLPADGGVPENR